MATTLTVTAKGQVTFRKDILEHLGVRPGDKIEVDKLANGTLTVHAERPKGSIADAFGMLKREGGPVLTIDEINAAIAEGWAGNNRA